MTGPAGSRRLPVVGVMGSGAHGHEDLAAPLGIWLARRHVHLLTGGGRGVMEAVSRAFHGVADRRGLVIGILPTAQAPEAETGPGRAVVPPATLATPDGYPNPWVELEIRTHLYALGLRGTDIDSRNHVNVLSSDVVVALPGGPGTASEVALAVRYQRPVIVWRTLAPGSDETPDVGAVDFPSSAAGPIPTATTLREVTEFVERVLRR